MIFPLAIHVSELLDVDAELRPIWQEISDNLPGSERRDNRGSGSRRPRAYGSFVYGGPGAIEPIGPEPELKARFLGFNALGSFIDSKGIGGAQIFRNRLRLREGPGAIDAEHIGGLPWASIRRCWKAPRRPSPTTSRSGSSMTGPRIGTPPSACGLAADSWSARPSKAARFPLVEIQSQVGGPCRWPIRGAQGDVTLYRNGKKAEDLAGETLVFPTGRVRPSWWSRRGRSQQL